MEIKNYKYKIKKRNFCTNKTLKIFVFKKDELYGLKNEFFEILSFGFNKINYFKNGYAIFEKDGKQGWIDKNGKILT